MDQIASKFLTDLNAEKEFAKRIVLLHDFWNIYVDSHHQFIISLLLKELESSRERKEIDSEAMIRFMIAYTLFELGETQKGEEEYARVMVLFPDVKNHLVKSRILNFVAFIHSGQGNFDQAFKWAHECIKEGELSEHKEAVCWGIYALGVLYFDLKDFVNSERSFLEAAEGFRQKNYAYGLARCETGLSSILIHQKKYDEAEKLLNRSLQCYIEICNCSGQSRSYNDLGVLFKQTGKYERSFESFMQALKIRRETNHVQGIVTTLNEIAELLLLSKKYTEAEGYLQEAKLVSEKINNRSKLYRTHQLFSQLFRNTDEPWKALEHYELYDKIKTEVSGETANNKIKELQTKIATEKADKEAEIERLRNVELKSAFDTIELKNKEITDSIQYALRIQKALLASDSLLRRNLNDFFVLYHPKDIVSGDFYWATEKDGRFFLAVCDSTGHGVPGAFMSLLNISFLNEAITEKQIVSTSQVFDHARNRLIENFSSEGGQDGMDGVLVSLDKNNVRYSAAHNSPVVIDSGILKVLDSDKMPVGKGERADPFKERTIDMKKGDIIYLITDGFSDQFGGPKGKKFKKKNLLLLLDKIKSLPMHVQKQELLSSFNQWKGNLEQVDDVLIVGFKI